MEQTSRPKRRPLIPSWVRIASLAALAVIAIGAGAYWYTVQSSREAVPDVTGMPTGQAQAELSRAGFESVVGERRFSSSEEGVVLDQDPAPETQVTSGDTVTLTVSAGSEEFAMPDVVGNGVVSAKAILEGAGLVVKIDVVDSEQAPDLVLESYPSPGASVRTGETIRLTVAGEGSASSALLPYQLDGLVFVVDPAAGPASEVDVTLEVGRRLQSLLEASGADVIMTRSSADEEAEVTLRSERATVSSATAAVGLDSSEGKAVGGVVAPQLPDSKSTAEPGSVALAQEMVSGLFAVFPTAAVVGATSDVVLGEIARPAVRLNLGSVDDPDMQADFRDPTWADTVARILYRALGERYGIQ